MPGADTSPSVTISTAEAADLLSPLKQYDHVAIAVSGGPDSVALMLLAAEWAGATAEHPRLTAVTVDHGLRPESRTESETVAGWAEQAGLKHVILTCDELHSGSRLQERAREHRYNLLRNWCTENGAGAIALAHTLDDQAETVLMRLARGSGLDGLTAMSPISKRSGIDLVRPFLATAKSRLIATLEGRGHPWIEDPSNLNEDFERVRIRALMPGLAEVGLTPDALALSASRLAVVRDAIEVDVARAMECCVRVVDAGVCSVDPAVLSELPEEIAARVLERCLTAVGGGQYPPGREKIGRLAGQLGSDEFGGATLGGCILGNVAAGRIAVTREVRPGAIENLYVARDQSVVWDGRFHVSVAPDGPEQIIVRPLGDERPEDLESTCAGIGQFPAFIRRTLTSVWHEDRLIGVAGHPNSFQGSGVHVKFDDRGLLSPGIWGDTL